MDTNRTFRLPAVLVLAALAHAAAGAQPVSRVVLPNGLTVIIQERHTAPVVTVSMCYRVGSRDEARGRTGLAHFIEHLMFKGTRRHPKGEIDRITLRNGGSNNAFTTADYTAYHFSFPRDRWQVALEIEADRMRGSQFPEGDFEPERQVVMEERRSGEDDPAERLEEETRAITFVAHPYGSPVIGWMADLQRLTRDDVMAFYRGRYVPANAILVIAGDVATRSALAAARRAFASVARLSIPPRSTITEPAQAGGRRVAMRLDTDIPRLLMLFHTPRRGHPHTYALALAAQVLGDGKSCRLYQRLVECDQVATAVSVDAADDLDANLTSIAVEMKPGADPVAVEAAVWEEVQRLGREPVGAEELRKARNQLEAAFIMDQASTEDLALRLGDAEALTGLGYLQSYVERIRHVTPTELQRVAAVYLVADRSTVGVLTPRGGKREGGGEREREGARERGGEGGRWALARGSGVPKEAGFAYRSSSRSATPSLPRSVSPSLPHSLAPSLAPLPAHRRVLANGLVLLALENRTLPVVTMAALVRAGAREDPPERAGLAAMAARMLDEGTQERSALELATAIESVGGELGASAGRETTAVHVTSLSRDVDVAAAVLADVLRRPRFAPERLEPERQRALADLRAIRDDPTEVAERAFYEMVYGDHPYHRPVEGYEKTVAAITSDDLRAFHQRCYLPERTTVVIVGAVDAERGLDLLARLFGDWEGAKGRKGEGGTERGSEGARERGRAGSAPTIAPGVIAPSLVPPVAGAKRGTRRIVLDKVQAAVMLGHVGVARRDPDFIPLEVLDTILGTGASGTFTARIPYQLRDVQGLAYSVGSSITGTAGLLPGVFEASLATKPQNTQRAIAGLLREIRRIREQPVTPQELRDAIAYLSGSYVFAFETDDALADYLLSTELYGLGINYRQEYLRRVRRVTRADLLRVARAHLHPEAVSVVIVGPEEKHGH
jgi:zinc protease